MNSTAVFVIDPDHQTFERAHHAFERRCPGLLVLGVSSVAEAVSVSAGIHAALFLLVADPRSASAIAQVNDLSHHRPGVPIVVLVDSATPGAASAVTQIGARAALPLPVSPEGYGALVEDLVPVIGAACAGDRRPGPRHQDHHPR